MPTGSRASSAYIIGAAVMVAGIAMGVIVEKFKLNSGRVRSGNAGAIKLTIVKS